ncbi:hypothetical protein FACS1894139_06800 [Planctomycetales bacterium]|nr:hypothetical protein FACS1894107_15360 [Planctomycetales bacterium]GHT02006.1 hypothetical protein FACS1894108_16020 [Planctomycetales bacterium]GHT04528.1 hypothetical protein FACS1894139_06800 [Planctomycetales bacterium]
MSDLPKTAPAGCLWGIFRHVLIAVVVLCGLLLLLTLIFMLGVGKFVGDPTGDKLGEKIIAAGDATERVALITLNGVIDGWGNDAVGDGVAHTLAKKLRAAAEDATVKVVLLEVDSPGGGLTASDGLHHEILRLKEAGKTVVAAVGDMAASGGYYVIAPADFIFAQPTGLIGSFGVIMEHFELGELLKKIGVKVEPIKSADNKDIGSIFREMTPAEKARLEKIVGAYHQRFVEIIADGRKLPPEKVAELATGEVFTAAEAVEYGLADRLGYHDDALTYAVNLAGKDPQVFAYEDAFSWQRLAEALSGKTALGDFLAAGPKLWLK